MGGPRHNLYPIRILPKTIGARCYNRVRLAFHRLPPPVRVPLENLRGLEVVIEDDVWLCVDANCMDRPVLAWTEFATHGRSALHEPVRCSLYLLHHQAGLVMGFALDALELAVDERLAAEDRE